MVARRTSQVRRIVGIQTVSWLVALKRAVFCLALCLLIVTIAAPAAAASVGSDSTPLQRICASLDGVIWGSDDEGNSWTQAGALPSRPLAVVTLNSGTGQPQTLSLTLSPELLDLVQDSNSAVRTSAVRAIGLTGDSAVLPALMQAPVDTDAVAGQRAVDATGRADYSPASDLLRLLESAPETERIRAASAPGALKSEEDIPALAKLLNSDAPGARSMAARALATIGTPEAIAALMIPLADQQLTSARHAAMGGLEIAGAPAVAPLAAALADKNPVVRANAAEMLGWLNATDATSELTALLSDSDTFVRAQAAWALGEMGSLERVPAASRNTEAGRAHSDANGHT